MQDLDFIEIGTSNFDTLLEKCSSKEYGISIEPLKTYLDDLPEKPNVKKFNYAVTHNKLSDFIDMYYIPKSKIVANNLQHWFKGCNTIGNYHPLHIKHNVQHLVQIDKVPLVNISEFLESENVRKIKFLKVDTEGHDVVILNGLYEYLTKKDKEYYPEQIQFESNEHTSFQKVTEIINLFIELGYKLVSRGYDTVLRLN